MTNIILYGSDPSPPVRACLLALRALNLPFELKAVDFNAKEHISDEYLKKNPQHTVPTLEDDGNFIWDSHAIIAYLVSKYSKDDTLYPKDFLKRAVVNQRLFFESGVMFQGGLRNITGPLWYRNETKVPRAKIDTLHEIYEFLEVFLKDTQYMAGNDLTIADFSIVATVTSLAAFANIDNSKYPKLTAWIKRMEYLPYYEEANGSGVKNLIKLIKSFNITIVP
ncbi:glutathione S-transferase 1-like [Calliphora vicina]|uniref:glutathione S-transferase 1-like n=1 Tax=Calliphora vicina TaxID=7373 RepID=UPI00325B2808